MLGSFPPNWNWCTHKFGRREKKGATRESQSAISFDDFLSANSMNLDSISSISFPFFVHSQIQTSLFETKKYTSTSGNSRIKEIMKIMKGIRCKCSPWGVSSILIRISMRNFKFSTCKWSFRPVGSDFAHGPTRQFDLCLEGPAKVSSSF